MKQAFLFVALCLSLAPGENGHLLSVYPKHSSAGQRLSRVVFAGERAGDEIEIAGVRLCWCPPDRFRMGSPRDESERRSDHIGFRVVAIQR